MSDAETVIYVVDDDPPVLKAVSRLIRGAGFRVMTFSSPQRFLDAYVSHSAGCLVLDLAMPGLSGLELQRMLAAEGSVAPIIFLTGRGDVPASVTAMKQGAVDFLTKPVERDAFMHAVRAAVARGRIAQQTRQEVDEIKGRLATLTPREYEVYQHVICGKLNKQTAAELGAAEKTIKIHRRRVMDKMKVQSLAELVRLADRVRDMPALD
jgi:FixJ family two-component response regulator